jgi:tetratricopeptide (TPR) repeat protein
MTMNSRLMSAVISFILVAVSLVSCSSTIKMYKGPDVPASETAAIEAGPSVSIETCDGVKVVGATSIVVKPGIHTVEISFREYTGNYLTAYSRDRAFVLFEAFSGHKYRAEQKPVRGPADTWTGYLIDVATGARVSSEGIDALSKAIEQNGNNTRALEARGQAHMAVRNWGAAIKDFDTAILLDRSNGNIYFLRGLAHSANFASESALKDYDRAIALIPPSQPSMLALAYSIRSLLLFSEGRYEKALADCEKLISFYPSQAEGYVSRGMIYSEWGKQDEAIGSFNRATELRPDFAMAYDGRGRAFFQKGQYELAIKEYDRAIELDSQYVPAYTNMILLRATCEDDKYRNSTQAIRYGDMGALFAENHKDFRVKAAFFDARAAAYAEGGDYSSAELMQSKAVRAYDTAGRSDKTNERYKQLLEAYKNKKTYLDWKKTPNPVTK